MAFFSKVGNILGQTASKQITPDCLRVNSSIFQVIRCMSSSRVFIGGVSYSTDDQSLKEAFARYGEVLEARIIMDRETGRSRGFGFVTYTSSEEASSAIQALDGQELHGRRVKVNYANDRPRSNFGDGGYGGGGGGYGGGGYPGGGGGYGGGGYGGGGGGGYGEGCFGGGAPTYDNNGGGGSGGGATGGSEGCSGPATGYYNSSSSYTAPPNYGGGNPSFSGEGGYGSTSEPGFGSGGTQFANNVGSSGFSYDPGDSTSTQGEFHIADDEVGKTGESRN